jgi:hypothetical protein
VPAAEILLALGLDECPEVEDRITDDRIIGAED